MTSDRGTNMVGGNKDLEKAIMDWNDSKITGFLKQNGIVWHFNAPLSSHFGGFFEREIRSIRKVFSSILTQQNLKLNEEELLTLMCETENILYNRPLTELTQDPQDLDALTPNLFTLISKQCNLPSRHL